MKTYQTIFLKLVCLALLLFAAALAYWGPWELYQQAIHRLPGGLTYRIIGVVILACIGLFGIIPLPGNLNKRCRRVTYRDEHGQTTIQLNSIERTLTRELSRQDEVRKARVRVEPLESGEQVNLIVSHVILRKPSGMNTRELTARLKRLILNMAREILGERDVVDITMHVQNIIPAKGKKGDTIHEAPVTLSHDEEEYEDEPMQEEEDEDTAAWQDEEEQTPAPLQSTSFEDSLPGTPMPSLAKNEDTNNEFDDTEQSEYEEWAPPEPTSDDEPK